MALAAVSTNLFSKFNVHTKKADSKLSVIPNVNQTGSIRKINQLQSDKVSFTSKPEEAKQAFVKVTQATGDMLGEVLIKAKEFAAKRLGTKLDDIEVDVEDFQKAINFFAKQEKRIHVGFQQIFDRDHGLTKTIAAETKTATNKVQHIGFIK